jgi:type II secretory pathway component GspD/PulD (secretin)
MRSFLLSVLLLVGAASAQSRPVPGVSVGPRGVSIVSGGAPLAAYLQSLAAVRGQSMVVLPGVPDISLTVNVVDADPIELLSNLLAAYSLGDCVRAGVRYIGPSAAVLGVCPAPVVVVPPVEVAAAPVPVAAPAPVLPAIPQRWAVRIRLLELADNSATAGGVDWSKGLLPAAITAGVSLLSGGAAGALLQGGALADTVSALEQRGLARKLDDVRLVLADGKPTVFHSGGTLNLSLLGGGADGGKIERSLPYGLTLNVVPSLQSDGAVSLVVQADLSSPVSTSNTALLDLATRSLSSQVAVKPGSSVLLASFASVRDEQDASGLPFLSSVPVVGLLAGRSSVTAARTSVVVTLDLEALP